MDLVLHQSDNRVGGVFIKLRRVRTGETGNVACELNYCDLHT